MKKWVPTFLGLLGLTLIGLAASAQQADAVPERLNYDLEMTKTLTLDPDGAPPVTPTQPAQQTPVVQDKPSSVWSSLAWLALVCGAAWLAYSQGKAHQYQTTDRLRRKLAKSDRQVNHLQVALSEHSAGPRKQWQNTLSTIENELKHKSKHIDQLRDENVEHKALLSSTKEQISVGQNEKNQLIEQQKEIVRKQENSHAHTLSQLESQHRQALADVERESSKLLDQANRQHASKYAELENTSKNDHQQLSSQIEVSAKKHSEAEERIAELENTIAAAESSIATLESDQVNRGKELDNLNSKYADATQRIGQFEESEKELTSQLTKAQKEFASLQTTLSSEQQSFSAAETKLKQVQSDLATQENANAEAISELKSLHTTNSDLRQQIADIEEKHQHLEEEHTRLKQEADQSETATQEQTEELRKENENQKLLLAETSRQVDQLEAKVQTYENELAQQSSLNEEAQKEQTASHKIIDEKSQELISSLSRITELEGQVEQRDKDLATIVDEIEPLREMSAALEKLREENAAQKDVIEKISSEKKDQEKTLVTLQEIQNELKKEQDEANQLRIELGEYNDSMSEMESRLAESLDSSDSLLNENTSYENDLAAAKAEIEELIKQSSKDRDQLTAKSIKLEQLEEDALNPNTSSEETEQLTQQLEQANAQITDLTEQHKLAETQIGELTEQHKLTEAQIAELTEQHKLAEAQSKDLQDQLHHKTELLYARDGRIQEMAEENTEKAHQVRRLKEQTTDFSDTISNLEKQLTQVEKNQLKIDQSNLNSSEQQDGDSSGLAQKLENSNREKDRLAKSILELENQLSKANEDVDKKNMRVLQLGTQLVDYKSRQEQYLQDMAKMEDQLLELNHQSKQNQTSQQDDEPSKAALRARDNIVVALEQQIAESDRTIEELKKHIENLKLSLTVKDKEPALQTDVDAEEAERISQLNNALAQKSQEVLRLQTDLKVRSDLVRVFEADSIELQEIEIKLEETVETNTFLQEELTRAVNEVNLLKQHLNKAQTVADRKKNIGRTASAQPKQHQQLLYRLATLEAENRQQLELINSLKTEDRQIN